METTRERRGEREQGINRERKREGDEERELGDTQREGDEEREVPVVIVAGASDLCRGC